MIGYFPVLRIKFSISRPFSVSINAMARKEEVHSSAQIIIAAPERRIEACSVQKYDKSFAAAAMVSRVRDE